MTLIITAATPSAIYQSADFRLTTQPGGKLVTDRSTKLVTLTYWDWHGFVAYTGLGSWKGEETSGWITTWLEGVDAKTPEDIEAVLRAEGTNWLRHIAKVVGAQRHTFVLAAFDAAGARVSVISNFEDAHGRNDAKPSEELEVSTIRPTRRAALVICGAKMAVSRPERVRFRRLIDNHAVDPARVRHQLAALNSRAAASPRSANTVSAGCSVVSLRPDGSGALVTDGPVEVRAINNGMRLPTTKELSAMLGFDVGNPVGMTMATNKPALPFAPCQPVIIVPEQTYTLSELSVPALTSCRTTGINDAGTIVGLGSVGPGEDVLWLNKLGSYETSAFLAQFARVDGNGTIIGYGTTTEGETRAFRWDGVAAQPTELGTHIGVDCAACASNSAGLTVGWVCIDAAQRGQNNHRPAAWDGASPPLVLEDASFDWGQCVDVNEAGQALVVVYKGRLCHALVWTPATGQVMSVGGAAGVYPTAINAEGVVLGNEYPAGNCVLAYPGQSWQRVIAAPGYYGMALNDLTEVAGRIKEEGYGRPWIRRASGEVQRLPFLRDHWTEPRGLNNKSVVIGTATSDHGTHAVVWQPL